MTGTFTAEAPPAPGAPAPAAPSAPSPSPAASRRRAGRPIPADILAAGAVVLAVASTLLAWDQIFAGGGHRLPVAASIAGAAVGAAAAARLIPFGRATLCLTAVPLVGLGLAAWYGTGVGGLGPNLLDGWKDVASVGLLLPTTRAFVIVPVVVSALATWFAVVLALRGPAITALLPVSLAHGVTAAYTVERSPAPWWTAPLLVAMTAVIAAAGAAFGPTTPRSSRGSTGPGAGTENSPGVHGGVRAFTLAASVGLAATLVVGAAAVGIGAGDDGFDLRARLQRPVDVATGPTPLASLKAALIEDSPVAVFELAVGGLGPDDEITYVPVAELDGFDGTIWHTTARFEASGAALPLPAQAGQLLPGQVTQTIALTSAYPFAFLPRVGVVRDVSGDVGLAWDERSGTMALIDPGVAEVELTLGIQLWDQALPTDPGLGPIPDSARPMTVPPELGEDQIPIFDRFTRLVSDGATGDYDRLVRLQDELRSDRFGYNTEAASGHSLAALSSYLEPGPDGSSVGFAEQSAALFAIVARQLGAASRVVVGYRLPEPLTAQNATVTVTEDMLHAWPEVWVDGVGWSRFEPTNTGNETTEQTARTPAVSDQGRAAPAADLPDLQEPVLIPDPETDGSGLGRWAAPLAVLALPLLYVLGVWLWKRLRRMRRRRGSDAEATIGAWLETRSRLAGLGLPGHESRSPGEVATELEVIDLRHVAEPLEELSPLVAEALFAPLGAPPSSPTGSADAAWRHASTATKAAAAASSRRTRILAFLDPRR